MDASNIMATCKHGLKLEWCAVCTGTVRAVEMKIHKARRPGIVDTPSPRVRFKVGNYPDSPFAGMDVVETPSVDQLLCSYCGNPVSRVEATTGKFPTKTYKQEIIDGPPMDIEEVALHMQRETVACRECAHLIKPHVRKDGTVVNTTQFTTLE